MAIVNTRGQYLNCYQTADKTSQVITKYISGSTVKITSIKEVNGITWGKVDDTGWVVVSDPMMSYPYVLLDDTLVGEQFNLPQEIKDKQNGSYDDADDGYYETLTRGVVNLGNKLFYDVEIEEEKLKLNPVTGERSIINTSKIDPSYPQIVQNDYGFPYVTNYINASNMFKYNYYMDYAKDGLDADMDRIRRSSNYDIMNTDVLTRKYMRNYNRFKMPNPNDVFTKGFPHIFITRPCCNILIHRGQGEYSLSDTCGTDNKYINALKNNKELLVELTGPTEYNHDFSLFLSNKAQSIDINDTRLETDGYGKTLLGYQVAYAKHAAKSKAMGEFSIKYTDDRNLNILKIHDYWEDYIDKVYRGRFSPLSSNIYDKTLDYVSSLYYILTAEDGETILYWVKYFGVFPLNLPESVLDMQENTFVKTPEYNISYAYSFKSEPFDPKVIVDFNINSNTTSTEDFKYVKTYAKDRYGVGDTWVGAPFIELCPLQSGGFVYKLRYRRSPDLL